MMGEREGEGKRKIVCVRRISFIISSSSSDFLTSEIIGHEEEHSYSSSEEASASPPSLGWAIKENVGTEDCTSTNCSEDGKKTPLDNRKLEKQRLHNFRKDLQNCCLEKDMSGCGNGFCAALAISNAITNLCGMLFLLFCLPMWAFVSDFMLVNYYWFSSLMVISLSLPFEATLFGQIWRLEPVPWQTFPDGSKLELFPGLPLTTLDMSKIQYNKDVGKSILESYSRVLESLAVNIIARIDDVLYVNDLTNHSDQLSSLSRIGLIGQKRHSVPYSVPFPSTPYRTAFSTPNFSLAQLATPAKGDRSPFLSSSKVPQRGTGVTKAKKSSNPNKGTESSSTITQEASVSFEYLKAAVSLSKLEPVPEKEP
ncbi:hypothetical protein CXB51_029821 [Gossypium anomalum]|uniref:PRONE domain-containing protein n=1 Tax=Gossypium anomalum TaxID=47600 RepID=A0A8J6CNR6_9ROSI|nr:hypothetical protein CXB51_029821 [Gossypium anomalum]